MQPDVLTAAQLAARLQVDPSTVARWTRQGRLAVLRFGQTLRYRWPECLPEDERAEGATPPVTATSPRRRKGTEGPLDFDAWFKREMAEARAMGGTSRRRKTKTAGTRG